MKETFSRLQSDATRTGAAGEMFLRDGPHREHILSAALAAGAAILRHRRQPGLNEALKPDRSPVTQADLDANAVLKDTLSTLIPNLPIVSEEDGMAALPSGACWLVDPLDGTREFLRGTDEFTVNLALVEAGVPRFGVVHAPAMGLTYWGGPGIGAWRRTASGDEAIATAGRTNDSPLRVVVSASHLDAATAAYLEKLGAHVVRPVGSSIKICMVAEGSADLYPRFGPTHEWDTAAADAVLRGAGGGLYDQASDLLRYGKPGLRNPGFVARPA